MPVFLYFAFFEHGNYAMVTVIKRFFLQQVKSMESSLLWLILLNIYYYIGDTNSGLLHEDQMNTCPPPYFLPRYKNGTLLAALTLNENSSNMDGIPTDRGLL